MAEDSEERALASSVGASVARPDVGVFTIFRHIPRASDEVLALSLAEVRSRRRTVSPAD